MYTVHMYKMRMESNYIFFSRDGLRADPLNSVFAGRGQQEAITAKSRAWEGCVWLSRASFSLAEVLQAGPLLFLGQPQGPDLAPGP